MKILVCFKTGPEFERIVDADWENFNLHTDTSYAKRSFGCFDETALETALRLKDELANQGKDAECHAVTLGSLPAPLYRTLFAVGFRQVSVLEGALEFQPYETASALAEFIAAGSWDLILTGRQAGYADTGMVPLILAEKLKLPVITEAECLTPLEGNSLSIDHYSPGGRERLEIRLPALVVMGNSPVSTLRAATLVAQMQAAKLAPEFLPCGVPAAEIAPKLIREQSGKTCRFLPAGKEMLESAREIVSVYNADTK